MGRNRVDRAVFSRNRCPLSCRMSGEEMATILMLPVGPRTTLNRSILRSERSMSGTGGDDFMCGHCGSIILEDFDPSTVRGNPVYQCGICENNNDLPFRFRCDPGLAAMRMDVDGDGFSPGRRVP